MLEYAGHSVEREYYFNEGGRQVELFLASIEAQRAGTDVPEGGYQGEYIAELAQLEVDPVQHMLEEIKREVTEFRIDVDTWQRQTEVEQEVPDVIPKLDTYEAEGTLWARTSAYGDDKDRPLLRSEDGSYLYYAADVAYVRDKLEPDSTAPSTYSAPTITATSHGSRPPPRCSATTLNGSRCSSTSSSNRRGRKDEEDLEAARGRCS